MGWTLMPRSNRRCATRSVTHRGADYDRHDGGAGACAGVEPMLAYLFREKGGRRRSLSDTLRLPLHDAKSGQCGGGVGRRESDAVDEARRRITEVFDQSARAGDITAARRERLRQRAHPDVDVGAVDMEMLADAVTMRAQHADRVGLIHHEGRVMPALHLDQPVKRRDVAVHAVDAFDENHGPLATRAVLCQERIQRRDIVVRKCEPPGARQEATGEHAAVRQGIVNHQIVGAEEMADGGHVGAVSAHEHQRILDLKRGRQATLQFAVQPHFAGNRTAGRGRCAVEIDGGLCGVRDLRMTGQAQIVVPREVQQLAIVDTDVGAVRGVMGTEVGTGQTHGREAVPLGFEGARWPGKSSSPRLGRSGD